MVGLGYLSSSFTLREGRFYKEYRGWYVFVIYWSIDPKPSYQIEQGQNHGQKALEKSSYKVKETWRNKCNIAKY